MSVLKKVSGFINRHKLSICTAGTAALSSCMLATSAFAEEVSVPDITSVMVDATTKMANNATSSVTGVLPVVMGIVALGLVITIVLKVVKRVSGKA